MPAGGRGVEVGLVGAQDLRRPLFEHLGGGQQGGILGRGGGAGEHPGGTLRPATQIGHGGVTSAPPSGPSGSAPCPLRHAPVECNP